MADPRGARPDPARPADRDDDFGEDLFDFDELRRSTSRAQAELSASLGAALAEVEAAQRDVRAEVAPPVVVALGDEAHDRPRLHHRPRDLDPATAQPTAEPRARFPRAAAILLGAGLALNAVVALTAWRTLVSVDALAADIGRQVRDQVRETGVGSRSTAAADVLAANAATGALPEASRALDLAQRLLDEREFVLARRTLCELLAVVDALDQPARSDVEARARYLLADAWRLEADAATDSRGGSR